MLVTCKVVIFSFFFLANLGFCAKEILCKLCVLDINALALSIYQMNQKTQTIILLYVFGRR